jgi:aspartate aminotransferase
MINPNAYNLGANRSVIRDLFEYGRARAAVVGEENVFYFSLGNPSIPSPRSVNETIRAVLAYTDSLVVHGYTSAVGDYETRKAIADDLNDRYDAHARAENFFITCGAAPALTAVLKALAVPGGEVLAIAPFFPEYRPFTENAGLNFKVVPPDVPDFQINFDALEAMISRSTQAVILNSPNNPSGVVYSPKTLQKLGALLARKSAEICHPIYIISDEPYRELTYGLSAPWVPHFYSNTVVVYSYSKSLSLPGERIGYVYVPESADGAAELYAAVAGAARGFGHVCAPACGRK